VGSFGSPLAFCRNAGRDKLASETELRLAINTGVLFAACCLLTSNANAFHAPEAKPAQSASAASLPDAVALAGRGRLDAALAELNLLAKAETEEAGVERLRGIILYQRDQLTEAGTAFARAVSQDPEDRESVEMLGVTLYRMNRPEQAIPLLEQADAAPVKGANVEPRYVLGLCYTDAKRYDDARGAFAAQFGFAPGSAEAYLVAARMFLRREFPEQAATFAQKALDLNPALPGAHQLLGEVALARADLPTAVKELEAEQKLNPLDGAMYDRLGDAYIRNGQYEEARQALNKAVLLEPNATGPYILLGEALIKMGEPVQALHYLNRAQTMDPENYVTHNMLGQAYRAVGQTAEANREYKLAVGLQHRPDPKPEPEPDVRRDKTAGAH
jgi:predicted Zn-dependent protease